MTTISSIDARFAQTQVGVASSKVTASVQNLVSGNKTDASVADLSVGTVLASRVNTLRVAVGNAGQGKSVLNTAKGALTTILGLLQNQKSLSVKAADDSLSDNERGFLDQEFQAIVTQIDRIAATTNFNGKLLLDGSIDGSGSSTLDANTASGITQEQYSLLKSSDYSTSSSGSTITAGTLANAHGSVAKNLITFGADAGGSDAVTITFNIDRDGSAGLADTANDVNSLQSVTFTAVNAASSAVGTATAFVAAVNAAVSTDTTGAFSNFAQYKFTDNLDGTVSVEAKEAGTSLNNYRFSVNAGANDDAELTATFTGGNNILYNAAGAVQTQAAAEKIFSTGGTAGVDGIFHAITADKVASTALEGSITFGAPAAADNGVKSISTLVVTAIAGAGDTFAFDGVTFTAAADVDLTTEFAIGLDTDGQALALTQALNTNATTSADWVFTVAASTITATARYFGNGSGKTQATLTAQTGVATDVGGGAALAVTSNVGGAGGSTLGVDSADIALTLTIKDDNGVAADAGSTLGAAITFTLSANNTTTAYTAADVASFFTTGVQANETTAGRLFSFTNAGSGVVSFIANEAGTKANEYSFNISDGTATLASAVFTGGTSILGAAVKLGTSIGVTNGSNQLVSTDDLTFDTTLSGALTGLVGTFTQGVGNNGTAGGDDNDNTVQFQVQVGGKTYTSQSVILTGSTTTSTISNTIAAGTLLTFQSGDGPIDANGIHTNAAFQLRVGTAATLSDVTTPALGQVSLNTIVDAIQLQLDEITIGQSRSLSFAQTDSANSDHTILAANDTVLDGLKGADFVGSVVRNSYGAGDITLTSNLYAADGSHGRIGQFTVNSTTDTISTTIDGETFTAYLNSTTAPTTGGVQVFGKNSDGTTNSGSYSTSTKILSAGSGGTNGHGKLVFYSTGTTDGRRLQIDLKNLTDTTIDISTAANVTLFQDALNAVFGADATDSTDSSLSFQVGVASTDTIDVTIGDAQTSGIYQNAAGVAQTLSVDTKANAIAASDILDRALNNVVSLVSTVSANITAFDASIQNNNSSIQNADAARSNLLDTDYTVESTKFAENRVRVDAATAVLAQINTRAQNLLQLLRQ